MEAVFVSVMSLRMTEYHWEVEQFQRITSKFG